MSEVKDVTVIPAEAPTDSPLPDNHEDILKEPIYVEKQVEDSPDSEYSVEKLVAHAKFFYDPYLAAKKSPHWGQDESYFLHEFSKLKKRDKLIPVNLYRLRISFWNQYEMAVCNRRPTMMMSQVHGGICSRTGFVNIIWDDLFMCFLLCPPSSYVAIAKEALHFGMERVREMLSAKFVDDEGNLNPRAAEVVLKAVMMLDQRVKGAIVQKIDQRTLQVTHNIPSSQASPLPKSLDELDKLIHETKERLNILPPADTSHPEPEKVLIDVRPKSD